MVQGEITAFISPNGKPITSRAEYSRDLRESNAIPWEPGIRKDIERRKAENIEASFKPVAEAVDTIVRDMNSSGKLENLHA